MDNLYVTRVEVRAFCIDKIFTDDLGSKYLISKNRNGEVVMSIPISPVLLDKHLPIVGKWHVRYADKSIEIITEEDFNLRFRKKLTVQESSISDINIRRGSPPGFAMGYRDVKQRGSM